MSKDALQEISIKAYYLAHKILVADLVQSLGSAFPVTMHRNCTIIGFPSLRAATVPGSVAAPFQDVLGSIKLEPNQYIVVFSYGSVVFFNMVDKARLAFLNACIPYTLSPLPSNFWIEDDYNVMVNKHLNNWSKLSHDYITVRVLDSPNVQVISGVLGQTVAMEHYEREVTRMLSVFTQLNLHVEMDGEFRMSKQKLFKMVAANNSIMTDVITNLGVLGRSDMAWKFAQYHDIWEGLRDEFELESRFKNVDFQLQLIQHNTKFFVEVLHSQKSDMLEWVIIGLISVEIALSLYDIYVGQLASHL
jgi:uncharacterized Rmd1/YagE family protein